MNNRVVIGCVSMAMLLWLGTSCSPKKQLVSSPWTHLSDYEWFTAKLQMDVSAPNLEMNDISGQLRMRRDSAIWISASAMMGMESLRALITEDSVILINRMDKTFLAEPLTEVASRFNWPATLQENQALLLGEPVEIRFGSYMAKIQYTDIHWDEPTTFPIKINKNYERMKL